MAKPSDFPMAQSMFDNDGIYASNPYLKSIAMPVSYTHLTLPTNSLV